MPVKKVKESKPAVKLVKATKVKKPVVAEEKVVTPRTIGLSVPVFSLAGRAVGTLSLPKDFFGQKVNQPLLSQAIRVYTTNQKNHLAKTKTRGEVKASKAKIYRQKGTGKARHGAISAPIFVGGGIVFGPEVRKVRLDLPKKMKKAALISALSAKMVDKNIVGLIGEDKATGKTKEMFNLLTKISGAKKIKSVLVVTEGKTDNLQRSVRNIDGANILNSNLLNAYEVLRHEILIITKNAVEALGKVGGQK